MRLPFGFELKRRQKAATLTAVDARERGWHVIYESRPGAWQSDVTIDTDAVLAQATVFACMTLIASDIAKLELRQMQEKQGITVPDEGSAVSRLLRKPNAYQNGQQFREVWQLSKLSRGNTYAFKERGRGGEVVALHVLDPSRCTPLISSSGQVFYRLEQDDLAGVPREVLPVPASEIIHDRMNCLFHPLVGLSPIFACGLSATAGLKINQNAANFFSNMSRPSGVLTAPGRITDQTAERIKQEWQEKFGADKMGGVAVLGDSLQYTAMTISAVDAQLVETLKLTAEQICSVFHVPPFMVSAGTAPAYNNVEALAQAYYSQCLQTLIEAFENCLDDGLGLADNAGVEFDLDDLLRMDSATMTVALRDQVGAGITAPNEARRRLNQPPVPGGESPYLQQQNYSLAALARRDSADDPFGTSSDSSSSDNQAAADAAAEAADQVRAMREETANQINLVVAAVTDVQQQITDIARQRQAELDAELEAESFASALVQRFTMMGATDGA